MAQSQSRIPSPSTLTFFEQVYEVVKLIPFGRVTSYGAIARALGSAQSSRMVGWAMNVCHEYENSIPAHRVVNHCGLLTGQHHFGAPNVMQTLLENEGVQVKHNKVVNFKKVFWDPMQELINDL